MNKQIKIEAGARRKAAVKAGAYDGRFSHRVELSAKLKAASRACREGVQVPPPLEGWEITPSTWRI